MLIKNCRVYSRPNETPVDIRITGRRIDRIGPELSTTDGEVLDAGGRLVTPGFLDVHIHGAAGVEVIRAGEPEIATMTRELARMGTTSFLATPVVIPDQVDQYLPPWRRAVGQDLPGARILGLHLEGPFVNPEKLGGMQPDWCIAPTGEAFDRLLDLADGTMKMMTIAPETAPDFPVIQRLLKAGVVPALGHTLATYQQTREYFDQGIAHVTHLYNAMAGLHHREPGPLLAILESDHVTAQIICDGRHVSPDVIRWTYEQIGGERCVCITDGMEAMGRPEGRYTYNGVEYESRDGSAYYLNGTLIGTALPLAQMALNFHRFTGCDLETAVNAGTRNPARVLGIEDHKGSLEPGKDADIVIFDADDSVWATLVEGRLAYQAE